MRGAEGERQIEDAAAIQHVRGRDAAAFVADGPGGQIEEHLTAAAEQNIGLLDLIIRRRDAARLAVEDLIGDIERAAGIGREYAQRQGNGVVDGDEEQLALGQCGRTQTHGQHKAQKKTDHAAQLHGFAVLPVKNPYTVYHKSRVRARISVAL